MVPVVEATGVLATYGTREARTVAAGGNASVSAIDAQLVPAAEIH